MRLMEKSEKKKKSYVLFNTWGTGLKAPGAGLIRDLRLHAFFFHLTPFLALEINLSAFFGRRRVVGLSVGETFC